MRMDKFCGIPLLVVSGYRVSYVIFTVLSIGRSFREAVMATISTGEGTGEAGHMEQQLEASGCQARREASGRSHGAWEHSPPLWMPRLKP